MTTCTSPGSTPGARRPRRRCRRTALCRPRARPTPNTPRICWSSSPSGSGLALPAGSRRSLPTTSLVGSWTRKSEPGLRGDHDGGHVVVADAARFDHRDVAGLMQMSPSASWRLNCTGFIGLPASPLCGSSVCPGRGGTSRCVRACGDRTSCRERYPLGHRVLLQVGGPTPRRRSRVGDHALDLREQTRVGIIEQRGWSRKITWTSSARELFESQDLIGVLAREAIRTSTSATSNAPASAPRPSGRADARRCRDARPGQGRAGRRVEQCRSWAGVRAPDALKIIYCTAVVEPVGLLPESAAGRADAKAARHGRPTAARKR